MTENLLQPFNEIACLLKNQTAIMYPKGNVWQSLCYEKLQSRIKNLAIFLSEQGVQANDHIAILLNNTPHWPVAFFAIVSLGAVAIPINPQASDIEIHNILEDAKPCIIFMDHDVFLSKEKTLKQYSFIKRMLDVDSEDFFSTLTSKQPQDIPGKSLSSEAIACILYTSGTTGAAKGVMLSHGNLLSNCRSLYKARIIKSGDRIISVLPLHHAYPLTVTMLLPLLYGGTIVYPKSIKNEDILESIKKTSPTVFVAVPQILHALHQKITGQLEHLFFPLRLFLRSLLCFLYFIRRKTGLNLARWMLHSVHSRFGRSMRLFASGGAKLNEKVENDLLRMGFTISEGYGLSETSPVLTFNPPQKPKPGSAGIVIPDVEVAIANPNEKGIGEVIARGPNVMKGYYRREDLTKQVMKDGWFYTGDLGFFDSQGYLFLTGRSKDVIVLSSGLNIYPEDIEQAYMESVPIKEICVFEAPPAQGIQADFVLWAVVRPDLDFFKKYGEVNLRHVIKERFDNASKMLPAHQRLMGFSITLEDLPHTMLGKIKRFEVKDRYAKTIRQDVDLADHEKKKDLTQGDLDIARSPIAQKIIERIKSQFSISRDIVITDSLELDLGIDSLGRIELVSALESLFKRKIEDEIVGRAFTVKDLVAEMENLEKEQARPLTDDEQEDPLEKNYWKRLFQVPPEKENIDQLDLSPGVLSWIVGFLFLLPFYIVFKLFYQLKVDGAENVPRSGRHIFYANHTSYFDGLISGVAFPRFPKLDIFFIGFRPYFNVIIIRNLIKIARIIPLDFSSHLTQALRGCYYILHHEKNLFIFPEGLRTLDGKIGEFKKGFGILAKESQARLVPVLLKGAFEAWPRTAKFPKIHPIRVCFGKPWEIDELEKKGRALGEKDPYSAICSGAKKVLEELQEKP